MNILIITPIHPLDIVTITTDLYKHFSDECSICSPQMYALLAEETMNHKYDVENYVFTRAFLNTPKIIKRRNGQRHVIVFGNIDRRTDIHWDHIIGFKPNPDIHATDCFDPYIVALNKLYADAERSPIKWYTEEDIQYTFPTFHHLQVFLKTLGIKENIADDGDDIQ